MYTIILDAMGSDNGPEAAVCGAIEALAEVDDFSIVFVGSRERLEPLVSGHFPARVQICDATEVIEMGDSPVNAIRSKKDSSMVKGLQLLKERKGDVFVTAGSTGAVIASATMIVRRAPNVERAALAPVLPTSQGGWVQVVDAGANVDCKATQLRQFGVMGSIYMNAVMGIETPRVGLLNNGTEKEKGCTLTKEAYALLSETKNIQFVGNVEAREVMSGVCDVVVCDGFSGNVFMKATEGVAKFILSLLKESLMSSFASKVGALLSKKAFAYVKRKMDYKEYGGALLLGVNGGVIKAHGSSDERAFKNTILQARRFAKGKVIDVITESLASYQEEL